MHTNKYTYVKLISHDKSINVLQINKIPKNLPENFQKIFPHYSVLFRGELHPFPGLIFWKNLNSAWSTVEKTRFNSQ